MQRSEVDAYWQLWSLQGRFLPLFMAEAYLTPWAVTGQPELDDHFRIRGVLLEYIEGFTFAELVDRADQSTWVDLLTKAVHISHLFHWHDVINHDVRPENIMVRPRDGELDVIFIDLGNTELVDPKWPELDQWLWRRWPDEEGAICLKMAVRLRERGFRLTWDRTGRYADCDDDEGPRNIERWKELMDEVWYVMDPRGAETLVANVVERSRRWSAIMREELARRRSDSDWADVARERIRELEEPCDLLYQTTELDLGCSPGEPFFGIEPLPARTPATLWGILQ